MFYEELYPELGKLFYYIAAADGKVQDAEKNALQKLIHEMWEPLEKSKDEFGTDQAALIDFAFDYEESESFNADQFQSFEEFYKNYHDKFTPAIISMILKTGKAIASAYHGKNKKEEAVLEKLQLIFQKKKK